MTDVRSALVALRRLREDRAMRALSRTQCHYTATEADLIRASRQLDQWRTQAEDQQAEIYASLLGKSTCRQEMERAMQKVEDLRQRTRALERSVDAARLERDKALEALRQGRVDSAAATRATCKSQEVLDVHRREVTVMKERQADDDLDEVAVLLHGRSVT
jgi:chromosome segregation ATPase